MQDLQSTSPASGKTYLLRELAVPIGRVDLDLAAEIAGFLRVKRSRILSVRILRKSLDSRKRNRPLWRYSVEFTFAGVLNHSRAKPSAGGEEGAPDAPPPAAKYRPPGTRIAVIGSGPAGMAAALALARKGYQVQVFEQGSDVRQRFQDIRRFLKQNHFHPHSNILFGEGGAGTFSDGKLTCRTRTRHTHDFLRELVACGADEAITYLSHPHIGTDKLQFIIRAFREKCESLGCRFRFQTPVTDLLIDGGAAFGIATSAGEEAFDAVVLAAGHSALPLYRRLAERGVRMEPKPFSVGARVEHPQEMVNRRQLGENVDPGLTGAAEYYLTWNAQDQGACAYSFCMCPGGVVVPCADADDGLFTNGMSYSNRAGAFANSAVVVPVTPEELPGEGVLAGFDFIRDLEVRAFRMGGGGFTFPAQTISAYMENRLEEGPMPATSFPKPLKWANFRELFPPKVNLALEASFRDFDRKLPGFVARGLIIGPESRTSSPVRILRDTETLESLSTRGLFPLGEGAGYSGGIVSSGADGLRLAEAWADCRNPPAPTP